MYLTSLPPQSSCIPHLRCLGIFSISSPQLHIWRRGIWRQVKCWGHPFLFFPIMDCHGRSARGCSLRWSMVPPPQPLCLSPSALLWSPFHLLPPPSFLPESFLLFSFSFAFLFFLIVSSHLISVPPHACSQSFSFLRPDGKSYFRCTAVLIDIRPKE